MPFAGTGSIAVPPNPKHHVQERSSRPMQKLLIVAVFLVTSTLVFAQDRPNNAGERPATENCAFNFTTGSGHGLTKYCVTNNGNITQFSAVGGNTLTYEFLNGTGPATEGYSLCDTTKVPAKGYWDFASTDSGNWGVATAVQTGNTVKVTRATSDGIWQLVQSITEQPGSATGYGAAKITMGLRNLSTIDRFVFVTRYADVNAGSSTFNDFGTTETSVWGIVPDGNGPGLSATAGFVTTPFDFSLSFAQTVPDAPIPCQISNNNTKTFFEGDGGILQEFSLEIGPGKSKVVSMTYKPF
jgi:hypothetical protein